MAQTHAGLMGCSNACTQHACLWFVHRWIMNSTWSNTSNEKGLCSVMGHWLLVRHILTKEVPVLKWFLRENENNSVGTHTKLTKHVTSVASNGVQSPNVVPLLTTRCGTSSFSYYNNIYLFNLCLSHSLQVAVRSTMLLVCSKKWNLGFGDRVKLSSLRTQPSR